MKRLLILLPLVFLMCENSRVEAAIKREKKPATTPAPAAKPPKAPKAPESAIPAPAVPDPTKIETKATDILKKQSDFLEASSSIRVLMDAKMRISAEGVNQDLTGKFTITAQRPNKLAFVIEKGLMGSTLMSDGKKLVTSVPALKSYTVDEAPESYDGIAEGPEAFALFGLPVIVTLDMFKTKSFDRSMAGVLTLEYLGEEKINGVACAHLRATQEQFDWDVWIESSDTPWVHRLKFDLGKMMKAASERSGANVEIKSELLIDYTKWEQNEKYPARTFQYEAPEGYEEVEELIPTDGERIKPSSVRPRRHGLVPQSADRRP